MEQNGGWIEILSNNDIETLWTKLFKLVSRHSAVRNLFESRRISRDRLQDLRSDLTQDLFLRLYQKGRLQHYLDAEYSNEDVEHELYDIEIPNLVSLVLRERHPETYRMARRISILLRTSPRFQHYRRPVTSSCPAPCQKLTNVIHKLALRVYGLKAWPLDKRMKSSQSFLELIKEIPFRNREIRRTGRGSGSQVIISNSDLEELIVEVFEAIDSPADVRAIRSLVLSKLAVENLQFVSIEADSVPTGGAEAGLPRLDFADERPTPEEILLKSEAAREVDAVATELLETMREAVRYKPRRYNRLARVTWHCYFDQSSPSQTRIAEMIGISSSLVSHYRKLFDEIIRDAQLDADQYILLLGALGNKLKASITETAVWRDKRSGERNDDNNKHIPAEYTVAKAMSAVTAGIR